MDDDATERRGRLRLQWPTFRGSPVGWGIAAAAELAFVVMVVLAIARRGDGASVLDVVFVVALVAVFAVMVTGTVATIRHPRPGPGAGDAG